MAGSRWNGASFTALSTKKRWNGTTFVDLSIAKRWNGTSWVDLFAGGGSSIVITTADATLSGSYACDQNVASCPISIGLSDSTTYSISGGTPPYSISAIYVGDPVTVALNTGTSTITVSSIVGRNVTKSGEIELLVADSLSDYNTKFIPYTFEYTYTPLGGGEGPPPEVP